ncbi:MAG: biotin/lipoyl-binding protein [Bifidobacteriaceae bacterium]|jgi:biotin carboxyl carrier protein|nr:biotin/lipoyl-binding protein [Bifidobacteriaceae bacterium]
MTERPSTLVAGRAADPASRNARRRRRRFIIAAAACVVALGAGGGTAFALNRAGGPAYRTAVAEPGSVVQQASGVGTVEIDSQDQAAFPVAGTIEAVAVKVGDTVSAGQTLASLDMTDLNESVQQAEEALADAEDQLATDLEDQASGTGSSSTQTTGLEAVASEGAAAGAVTADLRAGDGLVVSNAVYTALGQDGGTVSGGARPAGAGEPTGPTDNAPAEVDAAVAAVKAAQDDLLAAYEVVQGLLEAASVGLEASDSACAAFLAAVFPVAGDSSDDQAADDGAAALAAIQQSLVDCQTAIAAAQNAQTDLGAAQAALIEKAAALNAAVDKLAAAVDESLGSDGGSPEPTPTDPETTEPDPAQPGPGETGGDGTGGGETGGGETGGGGTGGDVTGGPAQGQSPSGGQGSAPGGTASGGQGSAPGGTASGGQVVTAEQILSDQAQIKLLEAKLVIARSERQAGTLTAAIGGTVLAVNAVAGDSVSAGQVVAVVDAGQGFTVNLTLGLSTVKELAIGNPAVFTAGSTDQELTGQITSIGITNLSNTSVPAFAVALSVDQADARLFGGASVTVLITVASSDNVVTVPTSAVHISASQASVQVLRGSELTEAPVTVGALGAELTEIVDGVALGDVVVLADLSKDVIEETSSTSGGSSLVGNGMTTGGGLTVTVVPPGGAGGGPMMRGRGG